MTILLVILLILAILTTYHFFTRRNPFKAHGLVCKNSVPIFGSTWKSVLALESFADVIQTIYNLNDDAKYVGFYNRMTPMLMIRDPDLIKSIAVTNFDYFRNHRNFGGKYIDSLLANNLLLLRDDRWKEVRALITPAFTSSKMRSMFKLMSETAENVAEYLSNLTAEQRVVEMKDIFTRYTNDVFATCAFGISVDSLKDRENRFYTLGREALDIHSIMILKFVMLRVFPRLSKKLGVTLFSRQVMDFFRELVSSNIKAREEEGIVRPDFIQLMMETRSKLGPGRELTVDDITAQAFSFFFGGFETTSGLLCFAIHELAVHSEIQQRLCDEIDHILSESNSQVTFEQLNGLKFLDAVINETLRMYPIIPVTDRECTKRFELPPALPGTKPYVILEDSHVMLPIYAIQRDPKYFEKPNTFYPDRFMNKQNSILNSGAYLPFGIGPRNCIGNRFALVEAKVALFHILARCRFEVCSKTTVPMELKKRSVFLTAKNGFWLRVSTTSVVISQCLSGSEQGVLFDGEQSSQVDAMIWPIIAAVAAVLLVVWYRLTRIYSFFDEKGIPCYKPIPILGSIWKAVLQRITFAEVVQELYNLNPNAKYVGFFDFRTPIIAIRDLDLLKSVTVKNFEHFPDHRAFLNEDIDLLFAKNLFALCGDRWKEMRMLLSPAFTSSKMKSMFVLMRECAEEYGNYLASLKSEETTIELKDTFTRYTNDVIATCVFGVSVNSIKDVTNKFYVFGREATNFGGLKSLKFFIIRSAPWLARLLGMRLVNIEIADFFRELVSTTIKTRTEKGIVRPDLIQLMMENNKDPEKEMSINDMTAQAFIFFFGGFETTSTLMCFAAYEIGVNEDVQKRLQEEIDQVLEKCNGQITYDAINNMKYLDAVIYEALRMYPSITAVDRVCVKPFELPPAIPGAKPHVVREGDFLWIPIYGIQRDPRYYPEPEKFNPDRFCDDSKQILNSGAYLSFGIGPRLCIGNRFALMETKVLLFHIFAKCNLTPCSKTTIPMKLSKKGFSMTAENGFWFNVQRRSVKNTEKVSLLESPIISG
ncbi:uncharacterized protein LOC108629176 [Ceratina calcarata]|uniref:Uncharacterized protein LOC108629176 n=1 Tax=Ceratina calcarata TaxID=156304 RepID=A0AAJ7S8L8_9HYME|nr:uncharacterized protein LOC108629176 [Ceratina calcarata]